MLKKFICMCLFLYLFFPILGLASSNSSARIGNDYYDTLEDAIKNARSTDIIKLISNVNSDNTIQIDKVVNIDLNGKNISGTTAVFQIKGGTLNLTGSGKINETKPNYGVIRLIGSSNSSDTNYSVINIGPNVILEGWSGIFITHESMKSYGVVANLEGTINAVTDTSGGAGAGIYVNGNIKTTTNSPVINISDNAKITSTGTGLYVAGYSTINIGKATISGVVSGIAIKSGILNIDGAKITCTGENKTPTEGNNNGINASGTTIQIESNSGYKGDIELNISNGTFTSKKSNVVYEYIGKGNATKVKSLSISNGTFISETADKVFSFSDSLEQTHKSFISGGKYSSNPNTYLKSGYSSFKDENFYIVSKNVSKEVFKEISNQKKSNKVTKIVILSIIVTTLGILLYLNRSKILTKLKLLF